MKKSELMEWLKDIKDDEQVVFALFAHDKKRGYFFNTLHPCIRKDEDRNVITMGTDSLMAGVGAFDTIEEIQKSFGGE